MQPLRTGRRLLETNINYREEPFSATSRFPFLTCLVFFPYMRRLRRDSRSGSRRDSPVGTLSGHGGELRRFFPLPFYSECSKKNI